MSNCRVCGIPFATSSATRTICFDCERALQRMKGNAVEVVHGRWRWCGSDRWNDAYQCSNCGIIAMNDSNYCPNCGAKMDGGDNHGPTNP